MESVKSVTDLVVSGDVTGYRPEAKAEGGVEMKAEVIGKTNIESVGEAKPDAVRAAKPDDQAVAPTLMDETTNMKGDMVRETVKETLPIPPANEEQIQKVVSEGEVDERPQKEASVGEAKESKSEDKKDANAENGSGETEVLDKPTPTPSDTNQDEPEVTAKEVAPTEMKAAVEGGGDGAVETKAVEEAEGDGDASVVVGPKSSKRGGRGRSRRTTGDSAKNTPTKSSKEAVEEATTPSSSRPRRSTRKPVDYAHLDVVTVLAEEEDPEHKKHKSGGGRRGRRGRRSSKVDDGKESKGVEEGAKNGLGTPSKKKSTTVVGKRGRAKGAGASSRGMKRKEGKEETEREGDDAMDVGESVATAGSSPSGLQTPIRSKRRTVDPHQSEQPPSKRGRPSNTAHTGNDH